MKKFGFTPFPAQFRPAPLPPALKGVEILQALQKGINLQREGEFEAAEYQYQLVLRSDPLNAEAMNLMGTICIEAERLDLALQYMNKAVKRAPDNALYRNNLGNAYLQDRDFALAEKHLGKAVEIKPNFVEALCNLGKVQRLLLKGENARTYIQKALNIDPKSVIALTGMGELLVDMGEMEPAREHFNKALSITPNITEALCGLAQTQKFEPGAPELDMILKQIKAKDTTDKARVALYHAAGKILNDQGEYTKAIQYFSKAKKLSGFKFDIAEHTARYDSFIDTFDTDFFAQRNGFGLPSKRPVFIIGMPRSGTTLTEQICASHPDIYGAGELPNIRDLASGFYIGDQDVTKFARSLATMTKQQSQELAQEYLDVLAKNNDTALRVVDKMPHNYELLPLIYLLFPNATIIHCNREPIDNCVSCFTHNFSEFHGYNTDLGTIGTYYRQYHRLMKHWNNVIPAPILNMKYEDTVADIETRARVLINATGLPWDDACLSFYETKRTVRTPSRWQVRQPIYTGSVQRWKKYGDTLKPLKQSLGDLFDNP